MNNIGLIGLGVMGQNLVLNMSDKGYRVSVFNRTWETTKDFCSNNKGNSIEGFEHLKDFILSLERPRKIILLVKAGSAVDDVIQEILPFLDKEDIVIDSGNSFYKDSERREGELKSDGIRFIGLGISGGEEGARHGPSFMVGGSKEGFLEVEKILTDISAKDFNNGKCVSYFGEGGAGHYVKMVHNGIEYIDMQLIADVYYILKNCNKDNLQIAEFFKQINDSDAGSYLIEITLTVLNKKDEDGSFLIDKILDTASQKGTGQWASVSALEMGYPGYSFANAVFSRYISSEKEKRLKLSSIYPKNTNCLSIAPNFLINAYTMIK